MTWERMFFVPWDPDAHCCGLQQELPNFEGGTTGSSRTFQRVLLNTCQEEFEGAAAAREVHVPLSRLFFS